MTTQTTPEYDWVMVAWIVVIMVMTLCLALYLNPPTEASTYFFWMMLGAGLLYKEGFRK